MKLYKILILAILTNLFLATQKMKTKDGFQKSCTNINFDAATGILSATCTGIKTENIKSTMNIFDPALALPGVNDLGIDNTAKSARCQFVGTTVTCVRSAGYSKPRINSVNFDNFIENQNGVLTKGGFLDYFFGGKFSKSCSNISFNGNNISAECVKTTEITVKNNLDLNNCISNDNGNLKWRKDGNALKNATTCTVTSPFFSYRRTLECTLKNRMGSDSLSKLDLSDGTISNENGILSC